MTLERRDCTSLPEEVDEVYRADEYGLVPRDSSFDSDPKRLGSVEVSYENPLVSSGSLSRME